MQVLANISPNNRFLSQIQRLTPPIWEILDPPLFILQKNIKSSCVLMSSHLNESHFTQRTCYRPQMKFQKGNVFTSMCKEFCPLGGGCTPPWTDTLLGRHPPGQTPPGQRHSPADSCCSGQYATGMHSCIFKVNCCLSNRQYMEGPEFFEN